MDKRFLVKAYDISWTFKQVIKQDKIQNEIRFSSNITWGQGQSILSLALEFEDTSIDATDLIKVFEIDDDNPNGRLIYTWIVQNIERFIDANVVWIRLPLLGLSSIFTYLFFRDTWALSFNKNQDPAQTVKDIVDLLNVDYNFFSYDWSSIENYWTSVSLDFENDNCFNSVKKCIEATGFYFYVDQNWKVFFRSKPSTPTHTLTVQKDVEKLVVEENSENLVNNVIVEYATATKEYPDATSETAYWLREVFEDKASDLADVWAADEFWANYLIENKDPKSKTTVTVNSNYDLETINPWDTVKIVNFDYSVTNLQIVKLTYSPDKVILNLEDLDSFSKEVFKN